MKTIPRLLMITGLAFFVLPGLSLQAASRDSVTLEEANEVLDTLAARPLLCIPPSLLQESQGVAIIPGIIKAGFIVGGRHGRGVLLVRAPNGGWGQPEFISLTGGSIGWQVGIQSTDLVLIFKTRRGLERMRNGKMTLGADIAVAAGPVGRQAEAATDLQLKAEILSYSRSRGLFAGLSLEGAALLLDPVATAAYYRQEPASCLDPRTGKLVPIMTPSSKLQLTLAQLTATAAPAAATLPPPPPPQLELPASPQPQPIPLQPQPLPPQPPR